ncbi:hypothetical protein G7046_g4220 [Stylonectria norvegica]|nr:hypothetical protein G7046_g4220 [Stylonectria norvegica]
MSTQPIFLEQTRLKKVQEMEAPLVELHRSRGNGLQFRGEFSRNNKLLLVAAAAHVVLTITGTSLMAARIWSAHFGDDQHDFHESWRLRDLHPSSTIVSILSAPFLVANVVAPESRPTCPSRR